jgi:arsenite methyltransferase
MDCPRCHHQNADGSRFCGACGESLARDLTCSRCGHPNPPGQKFCNGCGQGLGASAPATPGPRACTPTHLAEKILTSRAALEGERKQVTVLFADVKGSMELAEQLDPEEWHRIMDRFFQLLAGGVHRFEGTVNQYTGDGIMALFGAPIAHEDHAQRACYAALHLQETLRRYADELRTVPEAGCCGPQPATIGARMGYSQDDLAGSPEGANLGLGCGAPLAHAAVQPGETVLDLGSGAGFDAFLAAREVGPTGRVIGVDMTPEMLERARRNAEATEFRNVEFRAGRIEALPVEDASVDVVISNCVINLVPDKAAVYREVARVLRPGGRVVVSDVVLERPLPPIVAESVAALTGCVAGAALRAEYLQAVEAAGLADVEVLEDRGFGEEVLGMVPDAMLRMAEAAGVDPRAVAATVRSVKVRARKP